MHLLRHWRDRPRSARGAVFAVGAFDGVHRGHRTILASARAIADRQGVALIVAAPPQDGTELTPLRTKFRLLRESGVDDLWLLRGAGHDTETFVARTLRDECAAAAILRDGEGDAGATSAGIRARLAAGDVTGADTLLGRPYEIASHVRNGRRLGRTIGFPTANLRLGSAVRPAFGVYAVRASTPDGRLSGLGGVANIGVRPTVDGATELLEAHLFDWAGDLYGRTLCVGLVAFLRAERRFAGIDELKAQIARDAADARAALAARAS